MAVLTGRMTKLEAVNEMLRSIGETPVNSLASGLPQAASAEAFLDAMNRRVQLRGWHVNTRYSFQLTKNAGNQFALPVNALWATPVDPRLGFTQQRTISLDNSGHLTAAPRMSADATKWLMYDMINNSEVWPATINVPTMTVDLIELLNFIDVTPFLQYYILVMATREFQKGDNQSIVLNEFTAESVNEAQQLAETEDESLEENNVLQESPTMYDIAARRNHSWGR